MVLFIINWIIGRRHFQWIHYRSILFTFSHARITSYLKLIHIELINQTGSTYLLPIAAMAGAGQVGAAVHCGVRCGKIKLRNTLKGALPGVLRYRWTFNLWCNTSIRSPFFTACIGGGVGGAVIGGIGHIGATAVGPVVFHYYH